MASFAARIALSTMGDSRDNAARTQRFGRREVQVFEDRPRFAFYQYAMIAFQQQLAFGEDSISQGGRRFIHNQQIDSNATRVLQIGRQFT